MGYYNSQYEDYYNQLKRGVKYSPRYDKISNKNNRFDKINFITKRIIRDLSGVLILSIIIGVCKIIQTPQTKTVYNYSKKVVSETYDYNNLKHNLRNIDLKEMESEAKSMINRLQINISQ
ncbi:hypothetical protein J2Z42_001678 [Clostridium algifaecis]|uniref:Uncharacterized protein n=1 Tax=Clostridium algifaecis TaxID=1472040 RepID=A0ABS4KSI6_9CLOT|nr:endopeptidase [Clostridium algifaecis]MBP2032999.1 hypothetical protein [Clostridium algifaecis]